MAEYSDLFDEIRASVTSAPAPEMEQCARRAAIEFFRKSNVWQQLVSIALTAGVDDYRIRTDGGRPDKVLHAVYSDGGGCRQVLKHAKYAELAAPERVRQPSTPRLFGIRSDRIRLYPAPESTESPVLNLDIAAVPLREDTGVPDNIFEEHFEGLLHGALWNLHSTPGKEWTSGELAGYHRGLFFRAVNNARRESETDGWAPGHVQMRKW